MIPANYIRLKIYFSCKLSFNGLVKAFVTFLILPILLFTISAYSQDVSISISGVATINKCETKTYTITLTNNSGSTMTNLVAVVKLDQLNGFSYVNGTSVLSAPSFSCNNNPTISGGYTGKCSPTPSGNYLSWNINSLCNSLSLDNGEMLTINFDLVTNCSAASGMLLSYVDYEVNGVADCDDTGACGIEVLPGATSIIMTPNTNPQVKGGNVTWIITVENSGSGIIENVEVTDVLDSGLEYVSSTNSGNNSGQTTIWTSTEYAPLASMSPGDILTMDITARVIACDNLENRADVRFGCDPGISNTCFNSVSDGGTAKASVQRISRSPLLGYTPPDINFTYCNDTVHVTPFSITNKGDGVAYQAYIIADLTGFAVCNVSAGAIYNTGNTRFELTDSLSATGDAGDSYNLSFDLVYNNWCGGNFPSGELLWQSLCKDECDNEYSAPVELSSINDPANSSRIFVSLTGGPGQTEPGNTIVYTVTSSYGGLTSCNNPSNSTGTITIVDTLPDCLTLVANPNGGVWNASNRTLTWTYQPPASLNVSYSASVSNDCATYCNTTFTNKVFASGTDCCGCTLNATDEQTTTIEGAEGLTADKTNTSPTERCDDISYTNTYTFSGSSSLVLSDLIFIERAELNQRYNSGLSVSLTGTGDITGTASVTNNTPTSNGNGLILDFSGSASTPLAGKTLIISYDLNVAENTVADCSEETFYSWSELDIGTDTIYEATEVSVGSPSMSVSVSGLGLVHHTCETKTKTITVTQTSDFGPKDVKIKLSGQNYFITNPGSVSCSGNPTPSAPLNSVIEKSSSLILPPPGCIPTIDGNGDYIWLYNDLFTSNGDAVTLTMDVQKRCTGYGNLDATVYFDGLCTDDATPDGTCSEIASETPALLLIGDLLIEKTPETYYATTNTVQWEIYVTNRGTGTAYNVWVDDVLGAGLQYEHGVNPVVVSGDNSGVTINDALDHEGNAINGASVEITSMVAGERRQITFIAKMNDCNNLTNDVTANWGCIVTDCQADVTDNSVVEVPQPNLINTITITPGGGVDACENPRGYITLKNVGQTTCYDMELTQTLPANLSYISGTAQWRINGGGWNGPNAAFDPVIQNLGYEVLNWSDSKISALTSLSPGDVLEIELDMEPDCSFTGGTVSLNTQYKNPCGTVFSTSQDEFTIDFNFPDVTVAIELDPDEPVRCNQNIFWNITVTNSGSKTLEILWLEDVLGAAFTYVGTTVTSGGAYINDTGDNPHGGQLVQYEILDLPAAQSVVLRMEATTDQASSPCSADTDNTIWVWWGCGIPDGSSDTKPGVDAPDAALCLSTSGVSAESSVTREPELDFLSISANPSNINACNDSQEITVFIENSGPIDAYNVDLVVTLPAGLTYISNSSESGLDIDYTEAIKALGAIADPVIAGNELTWSDIDDKGADLADIIQKSSGNSTQVLRFTVQSSCYVTDNLDFKLYYYDCCDDFRYTTSTSQSIASLVPSLSITKTPVNSQIDCGAQQSWDIKVTNNGTGDAMVVRIEDTPGAWIDVRTGGTGDPMDMGSGVYGWEINNLAGSGGSQVFTVVGTLNPDGLPSQADCSVAPRQNNVQAIWGCGTSGDATDNDPTTTGYDCTDATPVYAPTATLQMPDLIVDTIFPQISCSGDGVFSGLITVRVKNQGDGSSTEDFTVQVSDSDGWAGTGIHSGTIAAGSTTNVSINTSSWNPACHACTPYSFNATADLNNDICECDETNNATGSSTSYIVLSPDIEVDSETLSLSSSDDGKVTVTGSVTLANTGCGTVTSDIPMRFTLYDNTGCGGSVVAQWTETLSSVFIYGLGFSKSFTITDYLITANLCTNSTGCQFSIFVEADYNDSVCECDGTNNTYCADNIDIDIPDVEISGNTLGITCLDDGQVTVAGTVTMENSGCGSNLNSNIPVRFTLYDNTGCAGNQLTQWTQTMSGVNIAAGGGTQVFTITPQDVTTNTCLNSTGCQMSIKIEADYNNSIAECDGTNNTYCADNKSIDIVDLQPVGETISINWSTGNQYVVSGTVTIENNGCGNNAVNTIRMRFTISNPVNCNSGSQLNHIQWTQDFVGVNIPTLGGTQVFSLTPKNIDLEYCSLSSGCNVSFLIEADYNNTICECDGTNNSTNTSVPIVGDTIKPTITCLDDTTVYLDNNCNYTIGDLRFGGISDDNCGNDTIRQLLNGSKQLSLEGDSRCVTLTADDQNGNTNSCSFTITADDSTRPTITCLGDTTVYLDNNCNYTIGDLRFRGTSADNCGNDTIRQSLNGNNLLSFEGDSRLVTLTADDQNGNIQSCIFTITADDSIKPTLSCLGDTTVYLDSNCNYTIGDLRFRGISNDNCGNDTIRQSLNGNNLLSFEGDSRLVTLTADDQNGNLQSCTFSITADDTTRPDISCLGDTIVYLDGSCSYTIDDMRFRGTPSDNCGNDTIRQSLNGSNLLSSEGDSRLVTLTADDQNGNINSCSFTITADDTIKPTLACQGDTTVSLDKSCNYSIGELTFRGTAFDNCGIATITQTLSGSNLLSGEGDYRVDTLTVSDGNGNTSYCTFTITADDTISPTVTCREDTLVYLDDNCEYTIGDLTFRGTAFDNCGTPTITQTLSGSNLLSDEGDYRVDTLTVNDGNGNTNYCTFTITADDTISPTITCRADTVVYLDDNCEYTIGDLTFRSTAFDNCGIDTVTQSVAIGTKLISHGDSEVVTITADDGNGNINSCNFTVNAYDTIKPEIVCNPMTVQLLENGWYELDETELFALVAGTRDNCTNLGPGDFAFDNYSFNCKNTISSPHPDVQIIVTDNSNNVDTAYCPVTVKDVTPPVAICRDTVLALDEYGHAIITDQELNDRGNTVGMPVWAQTHNSAEGGSYDACRVAYIKISKDEFSCADIGVNYIKLTVKDPSFNEAECYSKVTIVDKMPPEVMFVANIDTMIVSGVCEIMVNYPAIVATDICGVTINSTGALGPDALFPLGVTTESYVITDGGSNSVTVSFDVTVSSCNSAPTIVVINNVGIDEDSGSTILLSGISPGIDCGAQSVVSVDVSSNNPALVTPILVYNASDSTGAIQLTPAHNAHGAAEITVTVKDDGGTANGGVDTKVETFTVTVNPVNDPPRVLIPIPEIAINVTQEIKIPISCVIGELFTDPDIGDKLTVSVLCDGVSTLPTWLEFENDTLKGTPSLQDTGSVNITVTACDIAGAKCSEEFTLTVEGYATAVKEFDNQLEVNMYPNPTTGKVALEVMGNQSERIGVSVTNITGKEIYRKQFASTNIIQLDLSSHVSGIYFVKLKVDGGEVVRKLILNRE